MSEGGQGLGRLKGEFDSLVCLVIHLVEVDEELIDLLRQRSDFFAEVPPSGYLLKCFFSVETMQVRSQEFLKGAGGADFLRWNSPW